MTELLKIKQVQDAVMHGIKETEESYVGFGVAYFSTVNFEMVKG